MCCCFSSVSLFPSVDLRCHNYHLNHLNNCIHISSAVIATLSLQFSFHSPGSCLDQRLLSHHTGGLFCEKVIRN